MGDIIDWEKQYINLEKQMKAMMKQTLRLLDENNFSVQKIVVETVREHDFITVVFNGDSPLFKFECYDNEGNLIEQIDYTFRNSLDISNIYGLNKVSISIKDKDNNKCLFKGVIEYSSLYK